MNDDTFEGATDIDGSANYTLEFKFLERVRDDADGDPVGWNDFWREDFGDFDRLVTSNGDPIYPARDFTELFA